MDAAHINPRDILTEPLTITDLANYFRIGRNTMRKVLDRMDGAERCGTYWRVPLVKMPPSYMLEHGLLRPSER